MNYQEIFEELLKKEIQNIPRPFGIFLSGGLDSGLLAAFAKPDFAITCNFAEGEKYDELEYAQAITEHLEIPLKILRPTKAHLKQHIIKAIKIIGKPINSVSLVAWYLLMAECQGKTMINGEGADEIFGGYSRYLILKHILELYKIPELKNYKITLDFLFKDIHSKLVETEMPPLTDMEIVMEAEYERTLPDIFLMEEKLATYWDVKLYQPYRTEAVRKFAAGLPMDLKISGWTTKYFLRKVAEKYLPKKVYQRTDKKGLVVPINKWLNWTGERGEFDKKQYMEFQKRILKINVR